VGERWWLTAVLLYLPRIGFGLPLPVLALALLVRGPRWLLVSQLAAAALLVFPLMGLRLHGAGTPTAGAVHLRVATLNSGTGRQGPEPILTVLHETEADVILLQETEHTQEEALKAGLAGYSVRIFGQFLLASRFPIQEVFEPPRVMHDGTPRSPRFVRYRVGTPAGVVQIYNVHPISPRDALAEVRGEGLAREVESGRLLSGAASSKVMDNTDLRLEQLEEIADDARQSTAPVIIAGDTNLPTLSWALERWFGDFQDGFSERGSGFGNTFPAPKHPWMRIDRVLADQHFRVLDFRVMNDGDAKRASDHFAVVADLELPAPAGAPSAP
jgi:endonuclease/exonuclease/phosphatase (EEP) superfamily protein YafD